jgi:hypothetical protein
MSMTSDQMDGPGSTPLVRLFGRTNSPETYASKKPVAWLTKGLPNAINCDCPPTGLNEKYFTLDEQTEHVVVGIVEQTRSPQWSDLF